MATPPTTDDRRHAADSFQLSAFNLVFVIRATCNQAIGNRYQNISRHISTAIVAEEKRTRYFTNEMKKWYQYQQKVRDQPNRESNQSDASLTEKMEHHYQKTMARSNLGKQLKKCFNILTGKDDSRDIYVGAIRVGINLNNHLALENLSREITIEPYHTIILSSKISFNDNGLNLPTDSSATLQRAVKTLTPFKNLIDTHHECDVLLIHLQEAALHLVWHGLAKIIYPIDKRARYKINEKLDLELFPSAKDRRFNR